jgi:hypothetical protein
MSVSNLSTISRRHRLLGNEETSRGTHASKEMVNEIEMKKKLSSSFDDFSLNDIDVI